MSETKVNKNGPALTRGQPTCRATLTPPVDILEQADELVLMLDLPGVKADEVEVRFERGELAVRGTRQATACPGGECLVAEHEPVDYARAFLISQDVAVDKITAELKHGVLTVRLPKAGSAMPRRVAVQGA